MSGSVVPSFIAQLIAAFRAALPAVTVVDGPFLQVPNGDYLCVGWSPYNPDAASSAQQWSGVGTWGRNENFSVTCYLDSYSGDQDDPQGRRNGAYALLATVESALRADPTVGETVLSAQLASHTLHIEQSDAGVAVGISFTVSGFTVI